jgi:hypothetical protein
MQNNTQATLNISITNYGLISYSPQIQISKSNLISEISLASTSCGATFDSSSWSLTFSINPQQTCIISLTLKSSNNAGTETIYVNGIKGIWLSNKSFSLTVTAPQTSSQEQQSRETQQSQETQGEQEQFTVIKDFSFVSFPNSISIKQGENKTITITVKNTGNLTLHNISLTLTGIANSWFTVSPQTDLAPSKIHDFTVTFMIPSSAKPKKYNIGFKVSCAEGVTKEAKSVLEVLPSEEYKKKIEEELVKAKELYNNLTRAYEELKKKGVEDPAFETKLNSAHSILSQAENFIKSGDYSSAEEMIETAIQMLNAAYSDLSKLYEIAEKKKKGTMMKIALIILALIGGGFLVYLLLPPPHGYKPETGYRFVPPQERGKPRVNKIIEELKALIEKIKEKVRKKKKNEIGTFLEKY